jgi:hypothetical protein
MMMGSNLISGLASSVKAYLSQKQHWLVQECCHHFIVYGGFSNQHGLAYDATTNPYLSLQLGTYQVPHPRG